MIVDERRVRSLRAGLWSAVRAPWSTRTWRCTMHLVLGLPVGLLSAALVLPLGAITAVLAVSVVPALPLLAALLGCARWLTGCQRRRFAALLGTELAAPPSGFAGRTWLRRLLVEARARGTRRQLAYHLLAGVIGIVGFAGAVAFWSTGLALSAAFLHTRDGLAGGSGAVGWTLLGVAVLLAAPWAVRGVVALDVAAARALLQPPDTPRAGQDAGAGASENDPVAVVFSGELDPFLIPSGRQPADRRSLVAAAGSGMLGARPAGPSGCGVSESAASGDGLDGTHASGGCTTRCRASRPAPRCPCGCRSTCRTGHRGIPRTWPTSCCPRRCAASRNGRTRPGSRCGWRTTSTRPGERSSGWGWPTTARTARTDGAVTGCARWPNGSVRWTERWTSTPDRTARPSSSSTCRAGADQPARRAGVLRASRGGRRCPTTLLTRREGPTRPG
jgi:hypothetical protein